MPTKFEALVVIATYTCTLELRTVRHYTL